MFSHTHNLSVIKNNASIVTQNARTVQADSAVGYDNDVGAVTNQQINMVVDVSEVKSLVLLATVAMTLKMNSSSAPAQTLNLLANVPVVWATGDFSANPLTVDITSIFVTAALAGHLTISILVDNTP